MEPSAGKRRRKHRKDFSADVNQAELKRSPSQNRVQLSPSRNRVQLYAAPKKLKSFTYEEKKKILDELNEISPEIICKKYDLSDRTLRYWKSQKEKIFENANNINVRNAKRIRDTQEYDNQLLQWVVKNQNDGVQISGPLLKKQALIEKQNLRGPSNFKASEGWLSGWKKRNNIRCSKFTATATSGTTIWGLLVPVMTEVIVLFNGYSKQLSPEKMDANCTCTLIKGPKNVIIDTMTAWDREKIIEALTQQDLQPTDIDYVVCTHSHADHIGNNNLFTNAEHIVGTTVQRGTLFYDKKIRDEGYQLCDDVKVVFTPGHTSEDVTVLVETRTEGNSIRYAITGDLFEKEEDIIDPSLWKEVGIPDLQKTQAQMRLRMLNLADYIIPGHGPMFQVTVAMRELVAQQICDL